MANEIVSYLEMCRREGLSLQRGMNFQAGKGYSIILMSVRKNAPYRDEIVDEGSTLVYEGHNIAKRNNSPDPKTVDQPEKTLLGRLTENGKFSNAARDYKKNIRAPEIVRVYEKLHGGIWSYNGVFHLVDSWQAHDRKRRVFKFKLVAVGEAGDMGLPTNSSEGEPRRLIPTAVKLEVWKRDGAKCVVCGATNELHFDHVIPFSKGGTSLRADNVQLLCARHNIVKHDKIE